MSGDFSLNVREHLRNVPTHYEDDGENGKSNGGSQQRILDGRRSPLGTPEGLYTINKLCGKIFHNALLSFLEKSPP